MYSWSGAGGISVGTGTAMQAMWCNIYSHYSYNLYAGHCQCYGELFPMFLIYVETNSPGSWFEMAVFAVAHLCW